MKCQRRDFLITAGAAAGVYLAGSQPLAVSQENAGAAKGACVAAFRCDITPPIGLPCYTTDVIREVERPLLAKGIVLQSAGERFVICALDICKISNGSHLSLRRKLADAAGTDVSRVAVQTVHQHSAPLIDIGARNMMAELDEDFADSIHLSPSVIEKSWRQIAAAVKQSLGRLEPFDRIGTGQAKVDRVASSRRPIDESGKIQVRFSTCKKPEVRALPEGKIDPYLKTITFARGDKPLVRLHYYATHPQTRYGIGVASSDVVGQAREAVEQKENCPQIYFNGCGGDITMGKYNDGSDEAREGLAQRLTEGIETSIAATEYAPAETLRWRTCELKMTPRTDEGYSLEECFDAWRNPSSNPIWRMIRGPRRLVFHGRANLPIELSSLQIGGVRILHLPGEPMIRFQLFAQGLKPDDFVAVAGYGDGGPGYLCTKEAFEEGGYEPTVSNVVPESDVLLNKSIAALLGIDGTIKDNS